MPPTNAPIMARTVLHPANTRGHALHRRDGFGIWETDALAISADSTAELLLMEVPMEF